MAEGCDTTIVLYHHPCTDGAFAALAAHLSARGESYAFVPHSTTRRLSVPELRQRFPGHLVTVHMLDYCGPDIAFMRELCEAFSEVMLIDHHKTARELLDTMEAAGVYPRNLNAAVHQDRSGCALARDHYRPTLDINLDALFLYVEDNDLWRHALPDSKAFTAGLGAFRLEYDFGAHPEAFESLRTISFTGVLERGRIELDARAARIGEAMKLAFWRKVEPWSCSGCINTGIYESPDNSIIGDVSELGHALAGLSGSRVGIIAWPLDSEGRPGWVKLSLRSVDNVDTTVFTKAHGGGGGHAAASGCAVTRDTWEAIKSGRS